MFYINNGKTDREIVYSFVKCIKTNTYYEFFETEKPYLLGRSNKGYVSLNKRKKKRNNRSKEYALRTVKRSKDNIRRLSIGNFNDYEVRHLVLTFKNGLNFDINNLKECNKRFYLFSQKMNKFYPDFKYIKVAEYQKRGAVHYHVICNLRYVSSKDIARIWGYGFIKIGKCPYNIAQYLLKYIYKSIGDKRFKGSRVWSSSSNLVRPQSYYLKKVYEFKNLMCDKDLVPTYKYSYKSRENGNIFCTEYDTVHCLTRSKFNYIKGGDF